MDARLCHLLIIINDPVNQTNGLKICILNTIFALAKNQPFMNFRKVNNITGLAVFLIACITYFLTREARGSLWDCGEFVSSAYKMQLPHPPGAPLFTSVHRGSTRISRRTRFDQYREAAHKGDHHPVLKRRQSNPPSVTPCLLAELRA